MIIDKYTKGILTLIALALTTLCLQNFNFIGEAIAAPNIQKVQICNANGICAPVGSGSGLRVEQY